MAQSLCTIIYMFCATTNLSIIERGFLGAQRVPLWLLAVGITSHWIRGTRQAYVIFYRFFTSLAKANGATRCRPARVHDSLGERLLLAWEDAQGVYSMRNTARAWLRLRARLRILYRPKVKSPKIASSILTQFMVSKKTCGQSPISISLLYTEKLSRSRRGVRLESKQTFRVLIMEFDKIIGTLGHWSSRKGNRWNDL